MKNIEDFDRACALILDALYRIFPHEVMLSIADLNRDADPAFLKTLHATVLFLEREGFIRYRQEAGSNVFTFCVLSMKGLSVLNAAPDMFDDKSKSLGEKIGEAVKFGSRETFKTLISCAVSLMAGKLQ